MNKKTNQIKQIADEIIYQSLVEYEKRHYETINQTTQKIVNSLIEVYRKKVYEIDRTIWIKTSLSTGYTLTGGTK